MRGRVDGCLGGLLARALGKPPSDRFERERVVADEVAGLVEERGRRLARLAVLLLRLRFSMTRRSVVLDLDLENLLLDARRPRIVNGSDRCTVAVR